VVAGRSTDRFKFNLDVSQIIHIPRNDAPRVIACFGDMSALVTQVLEPTIGNYFRNALQGSDIINFLKNRPVRQEEARGAISAALWEYNVDAVDTLIGEIVPPDELLKTWCRPPRPWQKRNVKLGPDILAGSGAAGGTLVDVLLANVIRENSVRLPSPARLNTSQPPRAARHEGADLQNFSVRLAKICRPSRS
jgi:SPFH domain / Band 7 family